MLALHERQCVYLAWRWPRTAWEQVSDGTASASAGVSTVGSYDAPLSVGSREQVLKEFEERWLGSFVPGFARVRGLLVVLSVPLGGQLGRSVAVPLGGPLTRSIAVW